MGDTSKHSKTSKDKPDSVDPTDVCANTQNHNTQETADTKEKEGNPREKSPNVDSTIDATSVTDTTAIYESNQSKLTERIETKPELLREKTQQSPANKPFLQRFFKKTNPSTSQTKPRPSLTDTQLTQTASAISPDRLLGTVVDDRYQIKARLATGGMATVYRAQDMRLDRPVALKIMHPHLAQSADFVDRFRREARAAARLTHPGIVAVYDQGVTDSMGYLVMELVEGPNLRTYLNTRGSLNVGKALELTEQILQALSGAHQHSLIHRDVKPENVLLPPNGPAKVADFGLARAASEVTAATTGSILGTVAYLAPEILTSSDPLDARVDIYAVGIMLYEMLTGQVPFRGQSPIQVAYLHVHQGVGRASEKIPTLPKAVDDLIATLTARQPNERPSTATQGLEELYKTRDQLNKDELEICANIPPAPSIPASYKNTQDSEAAVRTLTAIPIEGIQKGQNHKELEPANPWPRKDRKRRRRIISTSIGGTVLLVAALAFYFLLGPGAYLPMVDVAGRSLTDASKILERNHIEFDVKQQFSDTVAQNIVIKTQPDKSNKIYKWDRATIFVSKGIEHLTVPPLEGLEKEAALESLKQARFSVNTVEEAYSQTVPQGQIISQSPAAQESVPHNTNIKIIVSKGREPVVMTDLKDKLRDEAATVMQQLGLKINWREDFSDTVKKGRIMDQSTPANTSLFKEDVVTLTISKGPRMVEVPNVSRKPKAEAIRILNEAGLKVKESIIFAIYNTVADTVPRAGTKVEVGSTVTIKLI